MKSIPLPPGVARALTMLENAGYEAFIVGGCVRDALMGIAPKDYDITTSALPSQTKTVFQEYHVIETGIQHGTVTVMMDGMPLLSSSCWRYSALVLRPPACFQST